MARRDLPQLDLLTGFEAAARHLSFTRAAAELFLTQSAISRQVQALEEQIGTPLFQRRHRALLLTDAGQLLYRSAQEVLGILDQTTRQIRGLNSSRTLTVTTTISFASLWLIPRLPRFRERHPLVDVRISADHAVFDLTRDRIDVAIRYCAPERAPAQAKKLFGESVVPMCNPKLLKDRRRPLREPADLRHHILLHDDYLDSTPWLEWGNWLQSQGLADLKPAGDLRFSVYDQMIQAALDGQGVALGRLPLLAQHVRTRRLVMPFAGASRSEPEPTSSRAFYLITEPRAAARAEVQAFVDWILTETAEAQARAVPAPARSNLNRG
jgi:LysR family transcriptional regulator, glycine cleavage system transcriptional activator